MSTTLDTSRHRRFLEEQLADPVFLRAFLGQQRMIEARASVDLDLHSGVHTCYEGHDCSRERARA